MQKRQHPENFSVMSVYDHLTREDNDNAYTSIWKAKISEKLKIFMWITTEKSIHTKDNIKLVGGGVFVAIFAMLLK
jgi:hypothetical protein